MLPVRRVTSEKRGSGLSLRNQARTDGADLNIDVVVVGSGAAALTGALTASVEGLSVLVLEKTDKLGGTSAMSGAATWIPANHHARTTGIEDSPEEALEYLRATAPDGWRATEDALWWSFARNASHMLEFVERYSPVRYALTTEPDIFAEAPGAKPRGRMMAPLPLRRRLAGPYETRLRPSTLPHIFTYHETIENDLYRRPVRTALKLAPKLLGRWLTNSAAKGTALTIGLLRGCLDHGCRIELEARAIELITDDVPRVLGVAFLQHGRHIRAMARRGVLLATGGFEWNRELLSRHFPGPIDMLGSSPANEGDALKLAKAVGAAHAHMDQALIFPCIPTAYEGKLHAMPVPFHMEANAILVDRRGERFVNEFAVDLGEMLDKRDPSTGEPVHLPAWLIGDARFLRPAARWYARHKPDWITRRRTLPDLAASIGLSPKALVNAVDRFNLLCARGRDEDFGRGETFFQKYKAGGRQVLRPIEQPPYLAIPFNRCVLTTKGGLRTNEYGQVLRPDGSAIAGLYCAGAAMANPIGTRAISAGTTIGPNMTWGYICARSMLSRNEGPL